MERGGKGEVAKPSGSPGARLSGWSFRCFQHPTAHLCPLTHLNLPNPDGRKTAFESPGESGSIHAQQLTQRHFFPLLEAHSEQDPPPPRSPLTANSIAKPKEQSSQQGLPWAGTKVQPAPWAEFFLLIRRGTWKCLHITQ